MEKYTFKNFQAEYPDDDACLDAIMARRLAESTTCPGCGVAESKFHRIAGRRAYSCQWCGHQIYPCVGTPFEHSSTPLTLWFHAMYLFTTTRNGVAAKELQRQLGVTYKCAWRIGHELRKLMAARAEADRPGPMSGHVELDETYIGGKEKNKHASKKPHRSGGGPTGKTTVFGMLERDGKVRAQVVSDAKSSTLFPIIAANVEPGTVISTDEYGTYKSLNKHGYQHGTVEHKAGQYVSGIHHTNSIEGFWSHFKRGVVSTHVSISPQHMQKYVNEFAFRRDNRGVPAEMFNRMLAQISRFNPYSS